MLLAVRSHSTQAATIFTRRPRSGHRRGGCGGGRGGGGAGRGGGGGCRHQGCLGRLCSLHACQDGGGTYASRRRGTAQSCQVCRVCLGMHRLRAWAAVSSVPQWSGAGRAPLQCPSGNRVVGAAMQWQHNWSRLAARALGMPCSFVQCRAVHSAPQGACARAFPGSR